MNLNKPIFLVGLRASGKTALGKILSEQLFFSLYDTDLMIKNAYGKSISEIISSHGWEYFREKEKDMLQSIPLEKSIVSTGGGIILDADNRIYLKNKGICVFLDPPIEILCARLRKNPLSAQRPAFMEESMEEEVLRLHKEREELYLEVAHLRIDSSKKLEDLVVQIKEYIHT